MKKILFLIFLFSIFDVFAIQQVFVLNFEITPQDEIKILSLNFAEVNIDHFDENQNEYFVKILDGNNNILFFKPLAISFYAIINTEGDTGNFSARLEKVTKRIRLPYFDNAKYIQILHFNSIIKTIDISYYICNNDNNCDAGESPIICPNECTKIICGNKLCEQGENFENCPLDCNINDNICTPKADGKCDPDCIKDDPDCVNCGDNICEANENNIICPKDCKSICGNNICEQGESETCIDCKKEIINKSICGNGICEINEQCPSDCYLKNCGNRICEPEENYASCPKDCLSGRKDEFCDKILDGRCDPDCKEGDLDCEKCNNNGICDSNENIAKCPKDCIKKSYIIYFIGGLVLIILLILIAKYKKPE